MLSSVRSLIFFPFGELCRLAILCIYPRLSRSRQTPPQLFRLVVRRRYDTTHVPFVSSLKIWGSIARERCVSLFKKSAGVFFYPAYRLALAQCCMESSFLATPTLLEMSGCHFLPTYTGDSTRN